MGHTYLLISGTAGDIIQIIRAVSQQVVLVSAFYFNTEELVVQFHCGISLSSTPAESV